jgi:hypothetical protein
MKKVNKMLTYGVMLRSFIVPYVQFVIMLIELQKALRQGLKCLCSKSATVLSEWTVPKTMDVSYIFTALEIKKINKWCKNVRHLCTQYQYTLLVHMSITGVVIHYIGWGCQSNNPQEIYCFKRELCVRFVRLFQEHIPGVKWDMLV